MPAATTSAVEREAFAKWPATAVEKMLRAEFSALEKTDRDDVASDALVKFVCAYGTVKPSDPAGYAMTIARNAARDRLNTAARRAEKDARRADEQAHAEKVDAAHDVNDLVEALDARDSRRAAASAIALGDAVHAFALREFRRLVGRDADPALLDRLRGARDPHRSAREMAEQTIAAMKARGDTSDPPAWVTAALARKQPRAIAPRAALVRLLDAYDVAQLGGRPTLDQCAILSLLAGHWPKGAPRETPVRRDGTGAAAVAANVAAERRAMAEALFAHGAADAPRELIDARIFRARPKGKPGPKVR